MSTQGPHAEFPSAQNFHPEFGYFCPSARMRRKVRSALITVVTGMLIAAGAVAALAPQLAPPSPTGDVREEAALPAIGSPPLATAAGTAEERMPAAMTLAPPVTQAAAASRTQASCDDLSGSFLAPGCQSAKVAKSHLRHVARAVGSRVASVPIGRADAGEADPQRAMAAVSAEAAVATKEVPPGLPSEQPPAPAKKPVKTVHKPSPSRGNATPEVPAAAPAFGFGFFGFFHEPPAGSGGVGHVAVKPARGPA
jgi:hypothetical protein